MGIRKIEKRSMSRIVVKKQARRIKIEEGPDGKTAGRLVYCQLLGQSILRVSLTQVPINLIRLRPSSTSSSN